MDVRHQGYCSCGWTGQKCSDARRAHHQTTVHLHDAYNKTKIAHTTKVREVGV